MADRGRHRLTGYDLTISSDRAIPGTFRDLHRTNAPADIVVESLPDCAPVGEEEPVYRWDGETLVFSMRGVGRYHCRSGGVAIAVDQGADPGLVTDLLVATALPAVLWLRGAVVLHAAALVLPDGSGLALAGPSGIGKSTVAQALIAAGATLLADDTIRLARDGDRLCASGLAAGYHLAAETGDRVFCPVPERSLPRHVPLRAIVFLARDPAGPALARLDSLGGFERLLSNQHRPAIPALLRRRAETLAQLGFVARACEMYEWRRSSPGLDPAERAMLTRLGLTGWETT